MYQSVDAQSSVKASGQRTTPRLIMGFAVLFGLAILVLAAVTSVPLTDPGNRPALRTKAGQSEARRDYVAALSEAAPALRQARLKDFLQTHPNHARAESVRAQLEVLKAQESRDWAELSHYVYNPELSRLEKLLALKRYESLWDPRLLGGREQAVAEIRAGLPLTMDLPDAPAHASGPSDNDLIFAAESLAGGKIIPLRTYVPPLSTYRSYQSSPAYRTYSPSAPRPVGSTAGLSSSRRTGRTVAASPSDPAAIRPILDTQQPIVSEARIKKNVEPKYPRRPLRAEVEGMVTLKLYIDESGEVIQAEALSADVKRYKTDFIRAATKAAEKTVFFPKTVDGKAVPTVMDKTYRFRLEEN